MGKFRIKSTIIALSLFGVSLTVYGAYAGFFYSSGEIDPNNQDVVPDIESFDYPEYTVNFYSAGNLSTTGNTVYGYGRILKQTHTYRSYTETFKFPGNEIGNYSETTFSHWSTVPIYYESTDGYVAYPNNGSDQPLAYEDIIGKKYYADQEYKIQDIDWGDDNVIDLYEITLDNYVIIGNETEKTKVHVCDPGTSHINTGFSTNHQYTFPHLEVVIGLSGRPYNNGGPTYSFSTLYEDTNTSFSSKHVNLATHNQYYSDYAVNDGFRFVKPIPQSGENRVTLDGSREYTWVNSTEKIVETYIDTDTWRFYISPGYYFLTTVADTYYVQGVYSKYLIATEKHADCTFQHRASGEVVVNGNYSSSQVYNYASDENVFFEAEGETTIRWRWDEKYRTDYCDCIKHVGGTLNDNGSEGNTGNCLVEGTPILLADGSYTNVENIKSGDMVTIFNHETGELDVAPVIFNDYEPLDMYNVINLSFSNGENIGLVYEHAFFDLDENRYVYIRENNYQEYIGHRFYTGKGKGYATLLSGSVEKEYTRLYSPVTYFHLNYFTGSLLSMPGGVGGLFNIFEYDENSLRYDLVKKQNDIELYGLFEYSDFAEYASKEMFDAFPAKYLSVSIGKGYITMEHILYLINRYSSKLV